MTRIAYSRLTPWPAANTIVGETLQQVFREYDLDVFDVSVAIKRNRRLLATGIAHALRLYGADIARRRRPLSEYFWRTPWMFRTMRRMIGERFRGGDYAFSFQIQSMFDASLPGVPHFVYTDHTHLANLTYPAFDASKLYAGSWIELERSVYRAATLNFTWSTNISRSLEEQYGVPPERVACVYAGSNVEVVDKPLANDEYRNKNILFVGMDWERKGGPELLEAFARVRVRHADARLTIVGAAPAAQPGVEVVGRVPIAAVPGYYQKAAVFCLPTRLEPFGIVFVEALAHRLPVVGTTVGAVPDFVVDGRNGYLVQPGDVAGLATALTNLLDSPATCREFGEAGYAIARERYTWEVVGRRLRERIDDARAIHAGPGSAVGENTYNTLPPEPSGREQHVTIDHRSVLQRRTNDRRDP